MRTAARLALLVLAACSAASPPIRGEPSRDAITEIALAVGSTHTVELPVQAGTGYALEIGRLDESIVTDDSLTMRPQRTHTRVEGRMIAGFDCAQCDPARARRA